MSSNHSLGTSVACLLLRVTLGVLVILAFALKDLKANESRLKDINKVAEDLESEGLMAEEVQAVQQQVSSWGSRGGRETGSKQRPITQSGGQGGQVPSVTISFASRLLHVPVSYGESCLLFIWPLIRSKLTHFFKVSHINTRSVRLLRRFSGQLVCLVVILSPCLGLTVTSVTESCVFALIMKLVSLCPCRRCMA